ncbi:hypothetical protein F8280_33345 [Micromonospora noduli]|uniref:hypothetical protein n=1 Tax=Micromonospora noduli TaxID=709876 RepID=UPI000DC3BFB0|nr:hypothetical protein [Micromonospora noduli]KAB1912366.1 hypothetical protein F8280_33345 [Micromonospora noduli]RAO30105.1 hypothetical protein ONO86_05658 [Micromonospora noduli]
MRLRHSTVALTTTVLLAAGCGTDTPDNQAAAPPAPTASSAAPAPAPAPAEPLTAKQVLAKLSAAKIGLTSAAIQDEDTDPNDLLGRPNGYLSRSSADLPGGDKQGDKYGIERGLVIEVFPAVEDVERRSKYIQDTLKGMPILGTEYHYRADSGRVLIRVSGKVKPTQAKRVEAAVVGM